MLAGADQSSYAAELEALRRLGTKAAMGLHAELVAAGAEPVRWNALLD